MARIGKRKLAIAGGALVAVLGAVLAWYGLRAPPAPARLGPIAGAAAGRATLAALTGASTWRVPARCMEADEDTLAATAPLRVGERTYAYSNGKLIGGSGERQRALLGVVADARGAAAPTLANVQSAVVGFSAAHVDVVLALGGLGQSQAEIEAVLGVLAGNGAWLLVALPGDREAVAAHRAAIAALAGRGARVVDGSALGLLVVDGVTIGLLPGAPAGANGRAHGLVAGADGCARTREDVTQLAARLTAEPGPHVLAAHQPPRQRGLDATDVALGGVHVGEPGLAELAAHVGAVAFVHADVDETAGRSVRATWTATSSLVPTFTWSDRMLVSVGPLEALPHPTWSRADVDSCAVVVEIDHMRARVRPLRPSTRNPGNLQ